MKFGFIYITTCTVNNKKYLGQRKYSRGWKNYLGSGVAFCNAVEKYGKENFHREIICEADTAEELNRLEYELSVKYDVVNSDDWYNLCYGGYSTNGFKFSDETKLVMSKKKKGIYAGSNNPMFGIHRKHTEAEKKMISLHAKDQWGEKNWMHGKTYGQNPRAKSVVCIETGVIYDSAKRAAHKLNVNYSNLCAVIKGKRKQVGGLHFEYAFQQANTEITT